MKPFDPHKKSKALRRFKPTRKPGGVFSIATAFCDASLLALAFFLAASPFVLQPGINMSLPTSSFVGGARFGSMVLSITRSGRFYFNDEQIESAGLGTALAEAAGQHPDAPLIIEADENVPHARMVEAWNAAAEAGIREISMATGIAATEEVVP